MIITLTGLPGSGKSTIAKMLSDKLAMPWYSIGDLRGKMAEERGMTIDELNKLGETEDFTDKEVDAYQAELGKTEDNIILDGRTSWHFVPNSLKVFLDVSLDEASKRIFNDAKQGTRSDEDPFESQQQAKERIKNRLDSDNKRYKKYYNIEYLEKSNYDLVIDTTNLTPDQVVDEILKNI